jgi:hypothetical protein
MRLIILTELTCLGCILGRGTRKSWYPCLLYTQACSKNSKLQSVMEDSIFTICSQEKISKDSSINLKSSIKDSAFLHQKSPFKKLFRVMKYRNNC